MSPINTSTRLRPVKGSGWLWFLGILLIAFAAFLYFKEIMDREERRAVERFSQIIAVSSQQLPGKWLGEIDKRPATLVIRKEGNHLEGTMSYQGVEERLGIEFGREKNNLVLILRGKSYKRKRGSGFFYLDTFYGTLSPDLQTITGYYKDDRGSQGNWSVSKCVHVPYNISGVWEGAWEISGLWNPLSTNQGTFTLVLEQNGSSLVGTMRYPRIRSSSVVSGQACGNRIAFEYQYTDGTFREYIGTLDNTGIQAKGWWTQPQGSGSWQMIKMSN